MAGVFGRMGAWTGTLKTLCPCKRRQSEYVNLIQDHWDDLNQDHATLLK